MSFMNQLRKRSDAIVTHEIEESLHDILIDQEPIKVIVCGEINAGKSSFINSLFGSQILPSSISGHTAAVHSCKYGSQEIFRVKFRDANKADYVDRLTKEALRVYLNEAGAEIELIEIEHPMIPPGFIITDSPGINDDDPYRNTLVHAFMADADVLVFLCDINRPVTASEVGFLKTFTSYFRLDSCIFIGNKVDLRDSSEQVRLKNSLLVDLQKYINEKISAEQVALMTTLKEKDGGVSTASVLNLIQSKLKVRAQLQEARAIRIQIEKLGEECIVLRSGLEARKNLRSQYSLWEFKGAKLLESRARLIEEKPEILRKFRECLDLHFVKVEDHLVHICQLTANPTQVQSVAEVQICEAVSNINNELSLLLFKNPKLVASSPSMESISIDTFAAQKESLHSGADDRMTGQIAFMAAGLLAPIGIPLLPLAVAAWGLWKMRGSTSVTKESESKIGENIRFEVLERTQAIKTHLELNLEQWFEREIQENEKRMQGYLRDAYSVFAIEAHVPINEIQASLVEKERLLKLLANQLHQAA